MYFILFIYSLFNVKYKITKIENIYRQPENTDTCTKNTARVQSYIYWGHAKLDQLYIITDKFVLGSLSIN